MGKLAELTNEAGGEGAQEPTPFHEELQAQPAAQGQQDKPAPKAEGEQPAPAAPVDKPGPQPGPPGEKPEEKPAFEPGREPRSGPKQEQPRLEVIAPPVVPVFFDDRFKNASEEDLYGLVSRVGPRDKAQFDFLNAAHIELQKRYEATFSPEHREQSKKSIPILLNALKEGKTIGQDEKGEPVLTDKPLALDTRLVYHAAISSDLQRMYMNGRYKMEHATLLYMTGNIKDAEQKAIEAKKASDELPLDLLKQESEQLKKDMALYTDPEKRADMLRTALELNGDGKGVSANTLPLQTRKFLTMLYLGTELSNKLDGSMSAQFGKHSGFKPDKAFEMAKETREKTKEILGFDPLDAKQARQDPEVASLFGGLIEVMDNPNKYNLYKLVDEHQVEKMQMELKKHSNVDSMLVDVGVVALTAGTLALSRNPKVQAGVERMLGRAIPEGAGAGLTKAGGLVLAAGGAPLARHYGFKALSGVDETWADTGVHVFGSLAAAELGGRVLGSGSMITGARGRGIGSFSQFDRAGSAEWLTMHGYDTTGKLSGLLKQNGYAKEAQLLAELPTSTALKSEAGLQAIEKAGLTNARMGTVARAVSTDLKGATGFDSTKLANALTKGEEGRGLKTVGELAKSLEEDKRIIDMFLQKSGASGKNATVFEALGEHASTEQGRRIRTAMDRMGVENVGDAQKLASQLEKGLAGQFPKIVELGAAGKVNANTKLTDLAAMTNNVFDGPGLQQLLGRVSGAERAALLTDRILEQSFAGVGTRTKLQQAVLDRSGTTMGSGPSFFGVATPEAVSKARWLPGFMASGAITTTYNSIVKTWDLAHSNNPATGVPYTWDEAFKEAHLPQVLEQNAPELLKAATSFVVGTPGQALLGSFIVRPGAMYEVSPSSSIAGKLFDSTPFSHRAWSNWNATFFSKPGMAGVGALGGTLWKPIIEDAGNSAQQKERFQNLLKQSQKPIENKNILENR